MILQYIIGIAFIGAIIPSNNAIFVQSYLLPRQTSPLRRCFSTPDTSCCGQHYNHCSLQSGRPAGSNRSPSMIQLRQIVRSWQPESRCGSRLVLLGGAFYDDFEDFSDFGDSIGDNNDSDASNEKDDDSKEEDGNSSNKDSDSISNSGVGAGLQGDDAVMRELRKRMEDLSKQSEDEDDDIYSDDEDDDDDDSGSALPDLEGNTISSIDDLIGFAQQKAREKKALDKDNNEDDEDEDISSGGGSTWEDENWARPVILKDGLDIDDLLEGGIVLVANPAKFCSDLVDDKDTKSKGNDRDINSFLGGLFDDPFPTASSSSSNSISPALLAKFGITLPPSPDLGPDRRADLLPVVMFINRDSVRGCQGVLMNRRTGNLVGDLPANAFNENTDENENDDNNNNNPFASHPLSAFMIQPLWWAGSSPAGSVDDDDDDDDEDKSRRTGINAIDMVHACPYVDGSVPLKKSDGLFWGGSPIQAQSAMKDDRLEKPLSGFDFKFFIQTTRWLPSQLEQEIEDGVWYLATVSKEVLFRSRDRLGAKRAKPLWTEVIELLGDDYQHIRDQLYNEEDDDED